MTELELLAQRVATLERSRARLQKAVGGILLLVGAGVMMAQSSAAPTITAREIVIVDKDGRVKAKISGAQLPNMDGFEVTDAEDQHMLSLSRLGDVTTFAVNPPINLRSRERKGFGGFSVMASPTVTSATIFQD